MHRLTHTKVKLLIGLVFAIVLFMVTRPAVAQEAKFGYEGNIGPSNWAQLSSEYTTCATGTEQSPVNIPSSAPLNVADSAQIDFNYRPSALNLENTGHSLQANYQPGSSLELAGQSYELKQFHFHNPSEHTVDNRATPLTLHLVHENDQGEIVVVNVFAEQGQRNEALAPVFDNLPTQPGESSVPGASVNATQLLPDNQSYWRYNGSLTTPPCSEGVKWVVMKSPIEVSAAQIASHNNIYSDNARPIQPLNGREFLVAEGERTLPATGGPSIIAMGSVLVAGSSVAGVLALRVLVLRARHNR